MTYVSDLSSYIFPTIILLFSPSLMKAVNVKKITTKALIVFMGAFPWNDEKIASYKLKYNWTFSFIVKDKNLHCVKKCDKGR